MSLLITAHSAVTVMARQASKKVDGESLALTVREVTDGTASITTAVTKTTTTKPLMAPTLVGGATTVTATTTAVTQMLTTARATSTATANVTIGLARRDAVAKASTMTSTTASTTTTARVLAGRLEQMVPSRRQRPKVGKARARVTRAVAAGSLLRELHPAAKAREEPCRSSKRLSSRCAWQRRRALSKWAPVVKSLLLEAPKRCVS